MPRTVVLKFGGASVATPERFAEIAEIVVEKKSQFDHVVVVISAMGKTTDELIALAKRVNPAPPERELDMLLSIGERISISLLAMALQMKRQDAISFTGSQSGIITSPHHSEARILDVRPIRIRECLAQGKVVIVAGFQGVSTEKEITTLGRGGSDTSAVALGVALGAEKVEFFKDVDGIYTDDPKTKPEAKHLAELTYAEASEIISRGAKILHGRSVFLAEKNQIPLHILPFIPNAKHPLGTWIGPSQRISVDPTFESVGK